MQERVLVYDRDSEQPSAKACVPLDDALFEDIVMTRYSLRLKDGDALLPDDGECQEFASLDAVRSEAVKSAQELLSAAVLNGTAASLNQQIEVVDEHSKTVLTVPVGRAVGTETQR